MPVDDVFNLDELLGAFEPLSHEEMVAWVRKARFDAATVYMQVQDPSPWQGDVIPQAELHFTDREGDGALYEGPAILLSHGCDTEPDQDPSALLAPVLPVPQYAIHLQDQDRRASSLENLRKNRLASVFFLPAVADLPDRYVDFNLACTVSNLRIRHLFLNGNNQGRTRLSMKGWWLFTAKFAHFAARREDPHDYPRTYF